MCFDLADTTGLTRSLRAAWLSQEINTGAVQSKPKSTISLRNQSASLTALAADMYSASAVDTATVGCNLLDQLTAPPFKTNTYAVVERRLSTSPAKSASQYPCNSHPSFETQSPHPCCSTDIATHL